MGQREQTVCVKVLMMELVNLESDRNIYSYGFPQPPTLFYIACLLVPLTTPDPQPFRPKGSNSTLTLLAPMLPFLRTALSLGVSLHHMHSFVKFLY